MPGLRIWSSKNCSPKEKKSFKLKLRENSDYRRDEIYLRKSSSSYRVKNARKSLLKAFVSQKIYIMQCFSNCVPRKICRFAVVCRQSF